MLSDHVDTPSGRVAYREAGAGPVAVLLHGVFVSSYFWRGAMGALADVRRCIALDLLAHGDTVVAPGGDVSFQAQARMVLEVLDALGLPTVDLVGNDSGGAIAQIVAATAPERVRSLTLTDCDVHDRWPPAAFQPVLDIAASGGLGDGLRAMTEDLDLARSDVGLGVGYVRPDLLDPATVSTYLSPLIASERAVGDLERYLAAFDCRQTVAIEPLLRELDVPTLVVWAEDDAFFPVSDGEWLVDTIRGARPLVTLAEAKLFFPDEQPDRFAEPVRAFWADLAVDSRAVGRADVNAGQRTEPTARHAGSTSGWPSNREQGVAR